MSHNKVPTVSKYVCIFGGPSIRFTALIVVRITSTSHSTDTQYHGSNVKLSTLQVPPQPPETRSGKQSEAEQT